MLSVLPDTSQVVTLVEDIGYLDEAFMLIEGHRFFKCCILEIPREPKTSVPFGFPKSQFVAVLYSSVEHYANVININH